MKNYKWLGMPIFIALVLIGGGGLVWGILKQNIVAQIVSAIFGTLGLIFAFLQVFPLQPRTSRQWRITIGIIVIATILGAGMGSLGLLPGAKVDDARPFATRTSTQVIATVTPAPPSGSYSMFGFDPQHTRYNSYEKILNSNNVSGLMKYPIVLTEGPIWSSPTVVNGIIYVGSDDKKLYAISVTTGQPLWTGSTRAPIWSSPAVVNGIVYVGSNDGNLYAFSASGCGQLSCPPLWTASTGDVIDSSPTVVNHVVYVGSRDGNLYAFSASGCGQLSCPPLWTASTGTGEEIVASSPAVTNDIVYVGSWSKPNGNGGKLYAFSATGCGKPSCPPLWTASLHGNTVSSPAVANGVVYIGSDNGLYTFSATGCGQSSCFPLWTAPIGGSASSPAVANGVVYISSGNGKLYAFSATGCGKPSCPPLWTAFIGGTTNESSPAVANGVVYIGSGSTIPASDKFYAFSATGCGKPSCSPLWTASIGNIESSSAVANGIVYIGSIDHTLYEFHLSGMKP